MGMKVDSVNAVCVALQALHKLTCAEQRGAYKQSEYEIRPNSASEASDGYWRKGWGERCTRRGGWVVRSRHTGAARPAHVKQVGICVGRARCKKHRAVH